jgi:hypothetical protein
MSKPRPFDRNRARTLIMSDILSFYITRNWEPDAEYGKNSPSLNGFTPAGYDSTRDAVVGDLVILESAMPSKWQIGWLREIEDGNRYSRRYLIESLEDGSLCWWTNVGLSFMPPRQVRERYKWTDRQFDFQKRWNRVVNKHSAMRTMDSTFSGNEVTVRMSVRWALTDDERKGYSRTFSDYRKVTIAIMKDAVESMEAEDKAANMKREQND